ncbi:MAG: hypothetical protein AVO33_11285 [delta proteobacterium ML8_F1]|nr:MAG: hypothetical protein AVO33_11285 [delta proteobacterium ML8_F1]
METRDLIIRASKWEDTGVFYQWESRPEVSEFFSISAHLSFETLAREYIHQDEAPDWRQYTILLKETQEPIGRIILGNLMEEWKVEIFRIYIGDPAMRNKGLGKQAMRAVLALCFEEWGLKRVYLDHYSGNPASFLYQSLGFSYEGVLRHNCQKDGILHDVHLMAMLRDEYLKKYHAQDYKGGTHANRIDE